MAVAANTSPAMNVYVQVGSAAIGTGTAPSNYSYFVKIDTTGQGEQVTIATAASSPRIDYIVAYVNKGQAGSTSVSNNTNNVFMLADVQGTPAGSPVAPTTAQIQSVVGSTNPYIILAQIAVGANVTQITSPNITDMRGYAQLASRNINFATFPQVQTRTMSTNAGAGQTQYYSTYSNGEKRVWGTIPQALLNATPVYITVDLPSGFFNSITAGVVSPYNPAVDAQVEAIMQPWTTSGIGFYLSGHASGAKSAASYIIIGN